MGHGTNAACRLAASRVAYNPLPWALTPGGHEPGAVPPLPEIARLLEAAGLRAIQADVPDNVSAASYRAQLEAAGLSPAPGYFQAQEGVPIPYGVSDLADDLRVVHRLGLSAERR
jgi:hypothetical protein